MRRRFSSRLLTVAKHATGSNTRQPCLNGASCLYPLTIIASRAPFSSSSSKAASSSLPKVAQPSIWQSIVPRVLREKNKDSNLMETPKSKEWNPATFFIIIFLLIGSQAIQMIALRNDFTDFSRKADAKIALLREVIERVQRGEKVDVEGLLGTGNPAKEKEWEEVMREIEAEDTLRPPKSKRRKETKRGENGVQEEDNSFAVKPSNAVRVKGSGDSASRGLRSGGSEVNESGGSPGFY